MPQITTKSDNTVLGIQNYHAALVLSLDAGTASLRPVEWHQSQDHEMTFDVYHHRTLEWSSANVTGAVADADAIRDLAVKLQPLLDRVAAGFDVVWNGSNGVGTLTDDAQAASDEIDAIMERLNPEDWSAPVDVWDARDWIGDNHDIIAETSNEEIVEMAEEYEAVAKRDGIHLTYNRGETLADVITHIRDQAIADREEENEE